MSNLLFLIEKISFFF